MKSYIPYKVSEFLFDRHPYLPPVPEVIIMDPHEVAVAYNERCIPKLGDLLTFKELSVEKRIVALKTLNELVSHQETKANMIDYGIVTSAALLMLDPDSRVRREAAGLIGSLFFLDIGRKSFNSIPENYKILHCLIFDLEIEVKKAVGWLLYRLSLHKDGVLMLIDSLTVDKMVVAFNKYFSASKFKENQEYVIYLLDAFINCSMYDFGITHMLKSDLLFTFNNILLNENNIFGSMLSEGIFLQIKELILDVIKNITLIKDGKLEAIKENLIYTISVFLSSEIEKERLFSTSFYMSVANTLEAKLQICNYTIENKYIILEKLCKLLVDANNDIKENSKLALQIIAELPDGFLKITDILHEKLDILNEVFGPRSIKGLSELLPKLSKYKNPPHLEKETIPRYAKYIKGIVYFIKKYETCLDILIHETVNFSQKLGPFVLLSENKIYSHCKYILNKICTLDPHNAYILQKFFDQYGEKDKNISKDANDSLHLSDF